MLFVQVCDIMIDSCFSNLCHVPSNSNIWLQMTSLKQNGSFRKGDILASLFPNRHSERKGLIFVTFLSHIVQSLG